MALKTGLNFTPLSEGGIEADVWPAPSGHIGGSSYGMRALIIYLNLEGFREISLLGLALTLIFFVIVVSGCLRLFDRNISRLTLLFIIGGPPTIIALSYIGRFDIFVLTGSWLVALSVWRIHTVATASIGILLMLLGNPEHTAVAGFILLLLTVNPLLRLYRRPSAVTFFAGSAVTLMTSLWAASNGAESRITYWSTYLESSWANFFKNIPVVLYSGYAILLIVVVLSLISTSGAQRIIILIALFLIPTFAIATTLDQTRVFVGVSMLPIVALTLAWMNQLQQAGLNLATSERLVLFAAVAVVILPAIEVDQSGAIRSPYAWFSYLQSVGIQFLQ